MMRNTTALQLASQARCQLFAILDAFDMAKNAQGRYTHPHKLPKHGNTYIYVWLNKVNVSIYPGRGELTATKL